jgi:excisionase family DNA binding protein
MEPGPIVSTPRTRQPSTPTLGLRGLHGLSAGDAVLVAIETPVVSHRSPVEEGAPFEVGDRCTAVSPAPPSPWVTVAEAAEYLRTTKGAIYKRIKRGQLRSYRPDGSQILLRGDELTVTGPAAPAVL